MIFFGGINYILLFLYLCYYYVIKLFLYFYFILKVKMILINFDKKKIDFDINFYKCKK